MRIMKGPGSYASLTERAEALERSNRKRGLARIYGQLSQLEPSNPRWPHKLGDVLRRLHRDQQAVAAYQRAISQYMAVSKPRHALALCRVALTLEPDNATVRALQVHLRTFCADVARQRDRLLAARLGDRQATPGTDSGWPVVEPTPAEAGVRPAGEASAQPDERDRDDSLDSFVFIVDPPPGS